METKEKKKIQKHIFRQIFEISPSASFVAISKRRSEGLIGWCSEISDMGLAVDICELVYANAEHVMANLPGKD